MARESKLTKAQAIALFESGWWRNCAPEVAAIWQLQEPLLCMPFGDFHLAVEKLLGRSVWTHEFVNFQSLIDESEGRVQPPTMAEIIGKLPADKAVLFVGSR